MRSKSQQLMNEISAYVDQYYSERHTAPSVNEIAKGVGIAKTTSYSIWPGMRTVRSLWTSTLRLSIISPKSFHPW